MREAVDMPARHAEVIAELRVYVANAPDSLRGCIHRALDDYEASGGWESDEDPGED